MTPALLLRMRSRWRWTLRLRGLLRALAVGLPALALAAIVPDSVPAMRMTLLLLATGAMLAVGTAAFLRAAGTGLEPIARHLDRTVPEFEDSAGLLLATPERITGLENLQRRRILSRVVTLEGRSLLPRRPLAASALWLAASGALGTAILLLGPGIAAGIGRDGAATVGTPRTAGEAPYVGGLQVRIDPPGYTGLPSREVEGPSLAAPEGSRLTWTIEVHGAVDRAALVVDGDDVPLEGSVASGFRASLPLDATRLYFVRLEREGREVGRSDYARIEAIPDRPPSVRVVRPAPMQEIEAASLGSLVLEVDAIDDYGLAGASIVVTLAQGSGERVAFRERRLAFDAPPSGKAGRLTRRIDLVALGLEPGSELYLHAEVSDNRRPDANRTRTETVRIVVPGGGGPSIDLARGLPILMPPEFLRSQRQIILDTERLLAEGDGLRRDEFDYRSQLIGDDQSALRMRYGSILGEETEDGNPLGEEDEEADEEEPVLAGDAPSRSAAEAALPRELTHEHDTEESATFFPDPVRRTFRQMLMQMWSAEGLLRTNRPDEALPHEHEALRLLKSVQEASRIYVQKVGFQMPPLHPDEDRLTGDLSEVESRSERRRGSAGPPDAGLRRALEIVRGLGTDPGARPEDFEPALREARRALERRALADPSADLRGLDLVATLLAGDAPVAIAAGDLSALERALWEMLPAPEARPGEPAPGGGSLHDIYRRRLGGER